MISFSIFLLILQFLFVPFQVQAQLLTISRNYTNGPIILSSEVSLFFQVERQNNNIKIGLIYNDSETFSTNSNVWVGLGIGEPTSGSMLGADILTAIFQPNQLSTCLITDRYVPFTAYPLTEQPGPFPLADECDKPDWTLINCERDPSTGLVVLEIDRPLIVNDKKQDRDILPGTAAILYAYGNEFSYHQNRRRSTQIIFYNEDPNDDINDDLDLPDDVDGFFDFRATNYTIPSRGTTYACTTRRIPLPENVTTRMIVGAEPLIHSSVDSFIHHFTLYICASDEYAQSTASTVACDGQDPPNGPLGNPQAQCSTFVYIYAKGVTRVLYPEDVGILLEQSRPYLVMETHFDNPSGQTGVIDNSGIRVYYTDKERLHRAGSLLVGDSFVSRFPREIVSGFRYQNSCPSICTERFSEPINMFTSSLHMHTKGKEIYTNIFSKNNTFIRNHGKVNFWSDSFQKMRVFKTPEILNPGDQLQVSCIYDTSKRPNTTFGLSTLNEMCMDFILYYPLQIDNITNHEINACAFITNTTENNEVQNITFFGDNGRINEFFEDPQLFPFSVNPAFNDTVGAPTEFGLSGATCPTPSPTASIFFAQNTSTPSSTPTTSEDVTEDPSNPIEESISPTISISPSPSESSVVEPEVSATPEEDDRVCFPAAATVTLKSGEVKRMDKLQIGDTVLVGKSIENKAIYSNVFMFTHFTQNIDYKFIHISTVLNKSLLITGSHYVYVNDVLKQARKIKVGDILNTISGKEFVKLISVKKDKGLYNPQTMNGDIVVNGIVTSTFTEAIDSVTATALLAPLRWFYLLTGLSFSFLFSNI